MTYPPHLRSNFGMSEVHSHRLIALYSRFAKSESKHLLAAKPSVLYLLATTDDYAKVERLAAGGRIKVAGRNVTLDQLSVKDARLINAGSGVRRRRTDRAIDESRAINMHREISSALQKFEDVANDIIRFKSEGRPLLHDELVKQYIAEVISCLKKALKSL